MSGDLPNKARVVVVGGGVIGCSVAYHLAKIGWFDVVLVERQKLALGYVSSGMYGHTLGAVVGLGYVTHLAGESDESIVNGPYEIEVAGRRIKARASIQPMYDPDNKRIRC